MTTPSFESLPEKLPDVDSLRSRLRLAALNGDVLAIEDDVDEGGGGGGGDGRIRFAFGGEYKDLILKAAAGWEVDPIEAVKRMLTQANEFQTVGENEQVGIIETVPRASRLGQALLGSQIQTYGLRFEWDSQEPPTNLHNV